jgi:hypothetical protein
LLKNPARGRETGALAREFGQEQRALGVEHRRLEVEIEIALAAGDERDLAAAEGALLDNVAQPRASRLGAGRARDRGLGG